MKRKKIIFFIYQLGAGGAARTLLNITNHLDQTKFNPVIVTLNYEGSYEQYLNRDVTLIKLDTKRLRSAIFPLAKLIRQQKPQIIFSTIPNYTTIAILARLLSFTNAKNIVREAAYLGGHFFENMKLLMFGFLYRFSSRVIALSNGVKENLIKRYKINDANIEVIYNPVDITNIHNLIQTGAMNEQHEQIFSRDRKVMVTAGRLVKEKDHATLLRAFAQVNEQIKSELIILGEGELRGELQELANELAIGNHVHFIGFQENPYLYFNRADVFVLSSITEGFGHVLVEALAAGTLIVSTDCQPGSKEVLQDGEFGQVCEVGDVADMASKISKTLTFTQAEKHHRIKRGYARANDFEARKIVEQYEEVFSETIRQRMGAED